MTKESRAFTIKLWVLLVFFGLIVFAEHRGDMLVASFVAIAEALAIATMYLYPWDKLFLKIWQKKRGGL